ncbi:FMN-linked oxidoreductase [Punctularia strigosozonata HHB-11173 SS5]|uniref:FMN-linked oxidoreductase n=1 Tax=Punctularia strigosozonata (strain HHB-11173) TaxID=741275 RepID=UPI00044174F1|nr:FMN-linked oxidoreductase [Punctularia strigosozonata HHB-11173 SS5]EIN13201.1 FMN-linked oxidoreductase [Punctularia strigosozonata HHB-11173 SS5]
MAQLGRILVSPPLINTSCAWASEQHELEALYACPHTGAVTTRTGTLHGFQEDASHTVAFTSDSTSSINSYGYSPHPLARYLEWVDALLSAHPSDTKPFIVSLTASSATDLSTMLASVRSLHAKHPSRIAVELNTSCPNIKASPPPAYEPAQLVPLLRPLADAFRADRDLTLGLKLPPYVYAAQFERLLAAVEEVAVERTCPFAFFTCTNTLGNGLLFADQARAGGVGEGSALLGGVAGDALHALALGNVRTFRRMLDAHPEPSVRAIGIVGAGGVTGRAAAGRMRRAGAAVVGCATLLGREGVAAFEMLAGA